MKHLTKQLFRTKDLNVIIEESHDPEKKLKKVLGPFDLILLGIGMIIGAGIFATVGTATTGDALRPGAGPALMISFAITAVACGFAALCYAELAALVPISGSAYTYSYATFGELIAWVIGWDLMLEYGVGSIAVAISWSGYFNGLLSGLGITLPPWATIDFRTAFTGFDRVSTMLAAGIPIEQIEPGLRHAWAAVREAPIFFGFPVICNIPAVLIIAMLTTILVIGIKASARFNAAMVLVKLVVLGFFIVAGSLYVKPENWVPFAPNGFAGIRAGAAIVFFAFIGFDAVSTVAEETRNPRKDMPIGIIGSLVVCTIIYVAVSAVFSGLIPYAVIKNALASQKAEPLALAMQHVNLNWAAGIIAVGAVVAQAAVLLGLQLGQSRVFFSMSRDGLLPGVFSKVHHRFKTPYLNTVIIGAVIASVASFSNIDEMVDLTNIGTLFAFILVCFGVIILRIKEPHRPRAFRVPFNPLTPLLGVGACVFLMTGLPAVTWIRFVIWLVIGLVVYFSFSRTNSELHKLHHHKHNQGA